MDTAYVQRANGRFEIWAYSDEQRVYLWRGSNLRQAQAWAAHNYYDLCIVDEAHDRWIKQGQQAFKARSRQ